MAPWRSEQNPAFRNSFSETIFNQKYRHDGCETWNSLCSTLVHQVCDGYMSKDDIAQLIVFIQQMKFLPGGRYIYYAGRKARFWNNCFGADTKLLTDLGWVTLGLNAGSTVNVFSPVDGCYYPAEIKSHGVQPVQKITFAPVRGNQNTKWVVRATRTHHWLLTDGSDTYDLRVGDIVPSNTFSAPEDDLGFAHGFIFGDGNTKGQLRLCSEKDKIWLETLARTAKTVSYPEFAKGDPVLYFNQKIEWKELPPKSSSPGYIASFIKGWIAADGNCNEKSGRKLCSINKAALEWFAEHAAYAGIVITGKLRSQIRDTQIGEYSYEDHELYIQNFALGASFAGFKVVSIEQDGEEEVFCPFEPVYNRIVIDHGIDTFNCYLLKAEEDTREDWANLSWKSESCLMTGGGIGADYSIYRPKGSFLGRTGGTASGPLPKIEMTNEIGRRVMQGGSRRSAIYASLNWQHGDIRDFLFSKDWKNMPVGTTGYTIWDIKQQDFNFPAPLDMTNISVNYDTKWLTDYWRTGDVGEIFMTNVSQALSTAEPGFSFNFFDKENETLRNACTEVTSEDDSDVCNLGSLNLGRIESLEELMDVVALATKFLICGTLRAQLPYDKVHKVREKNRRLGLGLMGVHEWLIQRNSRYEVTPELHRWLAIYKSISDKVAMEFSKELCISAPIAKRAIAPTGTIGILAGTTTGIEPLFAVAYKRRYLKGTRWHYQYVVDSAAQDLIDLYGAQPESIESAIDLAEDYERRIRFQADVQDYVDQSISSTINLPAWGTEHNNPDMVKPFAETLARYAHRLRGFTCYPDGARGGQPLTSVPYKDAREALGEEFEEGLETHDVCSISGKGGSCGV